MGWFHAGDQEAKQEYAERARKRAAGAKFFLKVKETRNILFLEDVTDQAFGFWQHKLKPDGQWQESFDVTCTRGVKDLPCYVCEQRWMDKKGPREFVRSHVNVVTIVDLTPWQGQNGNGFCTKRILPMKQKTFELLKGKNDRRGGLKLWIVSAHRASEANKTGGETSPSVGQDYEPIVKLSDLTKPIPEIKLTDGKPHPGLIMPDGSPMDLKPFSYEETFAPTPRAELEKLFKSRNIADGNVYGSGSAGSPAKVGTEEAIHYDS